MPERKKILTINVITDDDTGMYSIGEIDGIFQEDELFEFVGDYNADNLIKHLAFLSYQVHRVKNIKAFNENNASADKCNQQLNKP